MKTRSRQRKVEVVTQQKEDSLKAARINNLKKRIKIDLAESDLPIEIQMDILTSVMDMMKEDIKAELNNLLENDLNNLWADFDVNDPIIKEIKTSYRNENNI